MTHCSTAYVNNQPTVLLKTLKEFYSSKVFRCTKEDAKTVLNNIPNLLINAVNREKRAFINTLKRKA